MTQKKLSSISETIAEQRAEIKENAQFLREQEELIKATVDAGNNHIRELTMESDRLMREISKLRGDKIELSKQVDDKRIELLGLM